METIKTLRGMRQSILDRGDGRELASDADERLLDVIDGLIADTDRLIDAAKGVVNADEGFRHPTLARAIGKLRDVLNA